MKLLTAIFGVMLLLVSTASAQVEEGDSEVQVMGYLLAGDGFSTISVQFTYGYFIKENIQIGAGPQISRYDYGGGGETNVAASFFGRYYFDSKTTTVPYLSAQWYQMDFSPAEGTSFTDYSFIQVGGGAKFFVNEFLAYDVSGSYGFGLGEGSSGVFIIMGGLSAFF